MDRGAIDGPAGSPDEAVREADLIVAAGPIRALPDLFRSIARCAKPSAVVTDVASVKGQVMRWARELLPVGMPFVGGHPMAGREVQGLEAAEANLLAGATYCLVPGDEAGLQTVRGMVEALGARPLVVAADEHDRAVAAASHLPFVVAAALVGAVQPELVGLAGRLAAGGFRDTTRVAAGSAVMHADICNFNAVAVNGAIERFEHELQRLKSRLAERGLEQDFDMARSARLAWATRNGGAENDRAAG